MSSSSFSTGDTAWVFVACALVFLMLPGLALFYGGLVRGKAVLNTLLMSFAAFAIVSVQWGVFGYSLAFAPGKVIGNGSWVGLSGVGAAPGPYGATIPHLAFALFQAMFAGITVALISGAIVERARFGMFAAFAVLWTTFVYDPLAHWVWANDGWLHQLGALDFAGGTVVHISAGTAAVVAALLVGRRSDSAPDAAPAKPHNIVFTVIGAGLLWVGWFGFNAGSALAADGVAANAMMTTHLAASAALVAWMLFDYLREGRATVVGAATGAVVGLVAITPAAGYVTPMSAIFIGAIGAAASHTAVRLRSKTGIDDALDVFACHGVAGIVGAVLTGVFATTAVNAAGANGALAGNVHQLWVQLLAVGATILFTAPVTAAVLLGLSKVAELRLSAADEAIGVDIAEHGEGAYDDGVLVTAIGEQLLGGALAADSLQADAA